MEKGPNLRKNLDAIKSQAKVLNSENARSVFGSEMVEILRKFASEAHTKSFFGKMAYKSHMDLLLDQIDKYVGVEGFNKSIRDAMNNPNPNVQDGFWHSMADMKNRNFPKERVKKVDMEFDGEDLPCVNCKFDVELNPTDNSALHYLEYKSYLDARKISKPQFLNYMGSISSLDELKYIFNSNKLGLDEIKTGLKSFIKEHELDIIENMKAGVKRELNLGENAIGLSKTQINRFVDKIVSVYP